MFVSVANTIATLYKCRNFYNIIGSAENNLTACFEAHKAELEVEHTFRLSPAHPTTGLLWTISCVL